MPHDDVVERLRSERYLSVELNDRGKPVSVSTIDMSDGKQPLTIPVSPFGSLSDYLVGGVELLIPKHHERLMQTAWRFFHRHSPYVVDMRGEESVVLEWASPEPQPDVECRCGSLLAGHDPDCKWMASRR